MSLNQTEAEHAAKIDKRYVYPVDAEGTPLVGAAWASRNKQQLELWGEQFDYPGYEVVAKEHEFMVSDPEQTWLSGAAESIEESMIGMRARQLRVDEEAKRRVAAETYTGMYKRLTWAELADAKVNWLVDGLIGEGSLNFLVAKRNTGKSFAYLDLTLSMATGKNWLGEFKTRPAKVFVVLGEGKHGFYERLDAWATHHGVDLADVQHLFAWAEGVNLTNDVSLGMLRADVADFQPDLVIFDTWSATTGLKDKNDGGLADDVVRRAKEVAQGAAVFFCGHPPHSEADGDAPRMSGSSSPIDSADTVMTLYRDRSHQTGIDRKYLALSTEDDHAGKNRNAPQTTVHGLYLESVAASAVLLRDDADGLNAHDRWCLQNMEAGVTYTTKELAELVGVDSSVVSKNLKSRLVETDKTNKLHTHMLTVAKAKRIVRLAA